MIQSKNTYTEEQSCHHCLLLQQVSNHHCEFCGARLHPYKVDSLQRSWLFLITGILLYIPANILPIMVNSTLGKTEENTIVGGVLVLWQHGSYPIALIIFIASVAVPIAKFLILFGLLLSEQLEIYNRPQSKVIAFRVTEFIGRWSMVDVFVVAFLAGLIQLDNLMAIYPGPAAIAFAGMVVSTMLAATSLETKHFWIKREK